MTGVFDNGANIPTNPRKHLRLEEKPPDEGNPSDRPDKTTMNFDDGIPSPPSIPTYRDSLLHGHDAFSHDESNNFYDEDIELLDGDVTRSIVEGLITVEFFERVQQLAEKSFDLTIVIKLLGHRIGYTMLRNKLFELWKPKQAFRLMDIDNDYYLISFKANSDFLHALVEGPWTIFRHYLIVEPWTSEFTTSQPFPTKIWSWIHLPGLPLEHLLDQEEILWRQKTRTDWITQGDRNTRYFHCKTITRKQRNKISSLKLQDGTWCDDDSTLQEEAIHFFTSLFSTDSVPDSPFPSTISFPKVPSNMLQHLDDIPSDDEIHVALRDMAPLKSPGWDGLHTEFFQWKWPIVGASIFTLIRGIFAGNFLEPDLNCTILVLIPKKDRPKSFSEFRPNSLCTVIYELLRKIIVRWLKPFFPMLISPNQTSFISGLSITENIIVNQEAIHSMSYTKSKQGWMAIKVDLEKSFDRLKCDIISDPLLSAGVRQGDPMSPFLFVLAMESLGHLMDEENVANCNPNSLVRAITSFSRKCWDMEIGWIPREDNKTADKITKLAKASQYNHIILEVLPDGILLLLEKDIADISPLRNI
ncbi:hypothetical protein GQ457_07G010140 [Hibiscus cannabinus]